MDADRARRLRHLMSCDGWNDLLTMLDESIAEPKDELYALITSDRNEAVTEKAGIRLGNRAKGLEDFREAILDARKQK